MSEQENYGVAHAFGARLLNHADNAALPVDAHDFSDAINRCLLVDKTMFIADILDGEAPVALCCRPKGFGKSMNLSMLKCYLDDLINGRIEARSSAPRFGRRAAVAIVMSTRVIRSSRLTFQLPL